MMKILITGGLGYIGSHLAIALEKNNYEIIIIDNLSSSSKKTFSKIKKLCKNQIVLFTDDLRNYKGLSKIFSAHKIDCVIHLAGSKSVSESMVDPVKYFVNNVLSTNILLKSMKKYNVKKLLFSSSATVYGVPNYLPIDEDHKLNPVNVYGETKLLIEKILMSMSERHQFNVCSLRYFNPVGSYNNGEFGEDHSNPSDNLIPQILNTISNPDKILNVYGDKYSTSDGSAVRDYIHIMDLISGHLKALENIDRKPNFKAYNLGSGRGTSVFEIITEFENILNIRINRKIAQNRIGDIAAYYCNPGKAERELNWKCERGLFDMCMDSYLWKKNREAKLQ